MQHLIQDILEPLGIHGIAVPAGDGGDLDNVVQSGPNVRIVLIETPANPNLKMTDIRRAAQCRAGGEGRPIVMVDNTLMGPTFQHPLDLGADICLYSATKYLSGFSDMIGGAVTARDPDLVRRIRSHRNVFGNILQPDECWMLDGRLPTVALRMNRSTKNAQRVAMPPATHLRV